MKVGNLIKIRVHGVGIITDIRWCETDREYQATIFCIKEGRDIFISDDSLDWIEND